MSLIDSIRKAFTKQPTFTVSSRSQWQDYSHLADSTNYLDQFFGWTYKAIKVVADSVIRNPVVLAKGEEDKYGEVKRANNDLLRDLKRFNGFQTLNEARWLTIAHKRLVGSAYWLITQAEAKGYRYELFILDPTKMSLKVDSFGLPKMYQYQTPDGTTHDIDPLDLIVFKDPNPKDWLNGYSVLQASRYSHNSYELAMKFNMNVFGNMGNPDGFIVMDGISNVARKRVERQLRQKYGSYKNAGKTGVLNRLAQWLPITSAPKDLQFKENIVLMRDEILSFHGVPKPLVGLTDSTYTNSFEAQKIFQQYTTHPELISETDAFNEQLLPKYYKVMTMPKDLFFVCSNPVEANMKEQAENSSLLYQAGIIKLNEAREMVNQAPDEENGDQYKSAPVAPVAPIVDNNAQNQDETTPPSKLVKLEAKVKKLSEIIKEAPLVKMQLKEKQDALRIFFYEKSINNEKTYETTCKEYFKDQANRIIKDLKPTKAVDGIDVAFIFNAKSEAEYAEKYFEDTVSLIARNSLKVANDMIDSNYTIPQYAKDELAQNLKIFSEEITDTTQKDLAKIIETSLSEGTSYSETAKQIKQLFDDYSNGTEETTQARATTIAITETNSISNRVYRATYMQSEIINGLQWLTAHDNDVRDAHEAVDFRTASIGAKFLVGGEWLEYPGDKNGSAGNVINCRCTIIPVIK
jgi:HK97 family phage portal protein